MATAFTAEEKKGNRKIILKGILDKND